uniref:RNA-directed DNA polymerase n=1 Tax=Heterorhabditis bacteriophora TaxID=37862 RepID=A0A1I7WF33_HETBA
MPPPQNVNELQSFLGMITYYTSFVSKMRQMRAPLDALLRKGVRYIWSKECQKAFTAVKEV